jgi:type IV pilus assembly protein PilX
MPTSNINQRGATLIVSLVLLLIVTLIGISGMETAVVEEKMSGSYRDHKIGFESAEQALLEGEHFVATTAFTFTDYTSTCDSGLCFKGTWNSTDPNAACTLNGYGTDVWIKTDSINIWASNNTRVIGAKLDGVGLAPEYIVEFLCHAPIIANPPMPPYVADSGWESHYGLLFRITAVGTGGTNNARVMLQSTYLKPLS